MEGALVALAVGACCGLPLLLVRGAARLNKMTSQQVEPPTIHEELPDGLEDNYGFADKLERQEYERRQNSKD